jgi:hypothetical protein
MSGACGAIKAERERAGYAMSGACGAIKAERSEEKSA